MTRLNYDFNCEFVTETGTRNPTMVRISLHGNGAVNFFDFSDSNKSLGSIICVGLRCCFALGDGDGFALALVLALPLADLFGATGSGASLAAFRFVIVTADGSKQLEVS